ncbi:dynein axonemal assembly factor 4 [Phlebotomus papatasi]|uniref:dynein axonemal assembly factor 4 n=1 Tax=Phlebotomus papatasi TaxID=29031 RepID=UPI0024836CDB|nr:dynein axonemal assembly factor 4 [Phlebotomus papatasi]
MVITLRDIEWTQTLDSVIIRVIFHGKLEHKKLDIFTHREFVKIHSPPFYREIFLMHPIDEGQSKCRVLDNEMRFTLKKLEPQNWENLEKEMEKTVKIQMKESFVTDSHVQHEAEVKEKIEKKAVIRRKDIEKVIAHESDMRKQIEEINKEICREENAKIEKLRVLPSPTAKRLPEKPKAPVNIVPEVRQQGNIVVNFTERRFPTPKRESQDHLEQEWFKKQHEARKVVGFVEEDLRPEEKNPQWLKDKASDFFYKKNYLGAISALTTAIQLTPDCYDLFLERSASHLAIGNFQRCIEDCSRAYELLSPAVDSNLPARIQCLARRGAALCKIGFMRQGLDELQAALKLSPGNEDLQNDVKMIEERLLQDSDTDSN